LKVLRLPKAKVELGLPLLWNVRDEEGHLLLSKGHVIHSESQLELLLARGAFVDIEEVRATIVKEPDSSQRSTRVLPPNLFGLWDKTAAELQELLVHVDAPDFAARTDQFAQRIIGLLDINPDIALYLCVRQDNAQHYWYGYAHCVHTAVLCVLMVRQLQWPHERMMSLVKAALTMNIPILELQGQMASQDVPMRDSQREKIHRHPGIALEILTKAGITDVDWLDAIAQHHERAGGSGYPKGLKEVGEMAVALRVADVFMAKISPRALREALSPQAAVRQLYSEDAGGPLSTAVVKQFGLYPPGDYVKLVSGELAVVVQRTSNAKAPIVAALTDAAGHPTATTVRLDTGQKEHAIAGAATDKSMLKRLAPERLYGFVAVPDAFVNPAPEPAAPAAP
jgi:HD-GYP domain-containing protein (c-di-GMP phosphodiesterase class II)